jgi:hypothetical protein
MLWLLQTRWLLAVALLATMFFSLGIATDFDCNVLLCPQEYKPLCGTDGNTYPSLCDLSVKACNQLPTASQLNVKHEGPCK